MALYFDGANDDIVLSIGNCNFSSAGITLFGILKREVDSAYHCVVEAYTNTNVDRWTLELTNSNHILFGIGNSLDTAETGPSINASDGWVLVAATKAAGTATPRLHKYVFSTNTWTHANATGTLGDGSSPGSSGIIRIGTYRGQIDDFQGDQHLVGAFNRALSDAEIENLSLSLEHVLSLAPSGLWLLNQSATGQKVNDLTGGGANETSRTGTSVSTNSVPLFNNHGNVIYVKGNTASVSSNSLTKSLQYAVKTSPATITKSNKYCVKVTPSTLTKSLKYTVKTTPSTLTKSNKYTVKITASTLTKSLKYCVKITPSTKTKSLQYAVRPSTTITKSNKYTVKITASTITKSLKYCVKITPSTKTKSLQYAVRPSNTVTKSLKYCVKVTASTITKSNKYTVRLSFTITKSLKYSVKPSVTVTKSLKYTVKTTASTLTKSLKYCIRITPATKTKSLQYVVKPSITITKSLKYCVVRTIETTTTKISESMASAPSTGTLGGDASHQTGSGGYLRLTRAVNDLNGRIEWSEALTDKIIVDFEFWTGGGSGADAVYFFIGDSTSPTSEDGSFGGYHMAYDEYTDQIQLLFNGSTLNQVSQSSLDNSTWRTGRIVIDGLNIKIYLDGVLKINYTDSARTLPGTKYGFGARTGGLNNEHRIRNVVITQSTAPIQKELSYVVAKSKIYDRPTMANLGVNYYHESMGYISRNNTEIDTDLDRIALVGKNIKVYHDPYTNAGSVTAADSLTICKNIVTRAKAKGFYVVWVENRDAGTFDASNWTDYSNKVIADATEANSVGADEFLVGNEISLHNDNSSAYNDTNLPAKIKQLVTDCATNFPGTRGYQEGWFKNDAWNNAGMGSVQKLYWTNYEALHQFRLQNDKITSFFGANGLIGEISTHFGYSDAAVNETEWARLLMRKYDLMKTSGLVAYPFTYRETTDNGFGLWKYSSDVARDAWDYIRGYKVFTFIQYIYNNFNDATTQSFGGDGVNSSSKLRVPTAGLSLAGNSSYGNYVFRGEINLVSKDDSDVSRIARVVFRYIDASNYYFISFAPNASEIKLIRRVSGSDTTLATVSTTVNTSDPYYFEVRVSGTGASTLIDVFFNDKKIIGYTDTGNSTINSGKVGFKNSGVVTDYDELYLTSLEAQTITAPIITKSLKYAIRKSPTITKSLRYAVGVSTTATKSLKYTVKRTASTITKSLEYIVNAATIITKSLKYTVLTSSTKTKSLAYAVRVASTITKSNKYTVKTAVTATKSLKYTVTIAQSAITKSLRYAITRASTVTKSLQYVVKSPVTKTKSLKYTVFTTSSITKSAKYTVRTTASTITKNLKYSVVKASTITKGLIYTVKPTFTLTKGLIYKVKAAATITKSNKYTVKTSITITKSLSYSISGATQTITKSLSYAVRTAATITKGLSYAVKTSITKTKSLRYAVVRNSTVTKSLQYIVKAPVTITKSLKYTVTITTATVTKSLSYAIRKSSTITKSTQYTVRKSVTITKGLIYRVVVASTITKSLRYAVRPSVTIMKSLKYTVKTTASTLTKSLKYTVTTPHAALTKSLSYYIRISTTVTKSLQYAVKPSTTITKSIVYKVKASFTLTKSLKYTVFVTASTITKSLKYAVRISQSAMTKSLAYAVRPSATITKSTQYAVKTAVTKTKSLKYTIRVTQSTITKSLSYAVRLASTLTKSNKYSVKASVTKTKSLQYVVQGGSTITKSLTYDIFTSIYSRTSTGTLPADDTNLATVYSSGEVADVATDNGVRVSQIGASGEYAIHQYKNKNSNNFQSITLHWNGKSDRSTVERPVYLQIYNYNTAAWETIDSENTVGANTDFNLDAVILINRADYYNINNTVACRVYQKEVA